MPHNTEKMLITAIRNTLEHGRIEEALTLTRSYAAKGNSLRHVLDVLFSELDCSPQHDIIFAQLVAYAAALGEKDYCQNELDKRRVQSVLNLFPDIYKMHYKGLLGVKLYNYHLDIFKTSLHGIGILNYETEELSGETWFLNNYLKGKKSPVVFDIGANVGNYSKTIKTINPSARVYAFEPHPKTFAILQTLATEARFEAFNTGMSDQETSLTLYDRTDSPDGSSHASLYKEVIEGIHQITSNSVIVQLTTLDNFVQKHTLHGQIDLLKIDTEGHELPVLKGAQKLIASKKIAAVQFEFNEMNVASRVFMKDFYECLPEYDFYRLLPDGLVPLGNYNNPLLKELFAFQNIVALKK